MSNHSKVKDPNQGHKQRTYRLDLDTIALMLNVKQGTCDSNLFKVLFLGV